MSKPPVQNPPQDSASASSGAPGLTPQRTDHVSVDQELRERVERTIGSVVGGTQRVQVVERVTRLIASETFKGPIPHPKHLQAYEQASPGLADRIVKMAEIAQSREEDRLDVMVTREYDDRKLGMKLGFAALVILLLSGTTMVLLDHSFLGGATISAAIIGACVGTFIQGRIAKQTAPNAAQ